MANREDVKAVVHKMKKQNKNLDRPRSEGHRLESLSTCVSLGCVHHGSSDNAKGMIFRNKEDASAMWGRSNRDRRPSTNENREKRKQQEAAAAE